MIALEVQVVEAEAVAVEEVDAVEVAVDVGVKEVNLKKEMTITSRFDQPNLRFFERPCKPSSKIQDIFSPKIFQINQRYD